MGTRTYKRLCLRLVMRRSATYYITKIVFVEMLIILLTMCAFAMSIEEDGADRLSFLSTMFLATTAFLFVISSEIPKSGFLNHLDTLMTTCFLLQFLASIVAAIQMVLVRMDLYVDKMWLVDSIVAGIIGAVATFDILWFWFPRTLEGDKSKKKEELTINCVDPYEGQYGVDLGTIQEWPPF